MNFNKKNQINIALFIFGLIVWILSWIFFGQSFTITNYLPINICLFIFGLWLLLRGSDGLIDNAVDIARHYRISDTIIGLSLVSIGTSLPELASNTGFAWSGDEQFAIGNVTGSNIANSLFILGVAAVCMTRIPIPKIILKRDAILMLGIFIFFSLFCYFPKNSGLSRIEGYILLLIAILYIAYLYVKIKSDPLDTNIMEFDKPQINNPSWWELLSFIINPFSMALGVGFIIANVVSIAEQLGIPTLIIGATVVAFGTSLPELGVTLSGIRKGKHALILGNIIGSNIFNLLLVMGISTCIQPATVSKTLRDFILPFMLFSGGLSILLMWRHWRLTRKKGIVLLVFYSLYLFIVVVRDNQ